MKSVTRFRIKPELTNLQTRWSTKRPFTKSFYLSCLLVLLIGCAQWLPLLNAKWSIRDDYRFVRLLGNKARIDFPTFLEQINPPDWHLGSARNTPVYYAVHASWMLVLGNNVRLWQVAKIVLFGIVLTLSFLVLNCWIGLWPSTLLSIYIGTLAAWEDVVPRANSELFGIAGLMLYLLGISFILQNPEIASEKSSKRYGLVPLLLAGLGAAGAVGSKENLCFTVLFLSICFIFWSLLTGHRALLTAQLMPIVLGLTIAYFIWFGISHNGGKSVYGQTFDLSRIARAALSQFYTGRLAYRLTSWLPLVLSGFYAIRFWIGRASFELAAALYEVMLVAVFLLNAGFYTGFPLAGRYEFPVNLLPVFAILPVISELEHRRSSSRFPSIEKAALVVAIVWTIPASVRGFSVNLNRSDTYQRETRKFMRELDKVSRQLMASQQTPIVFDSYDIWDYEALISLDIFLGCRGAHNERFAKLNYASSQLTDDQQRFPVLLDESLVGPGRRFKSLAEIGTRHFFRITISAPKPDEDATGNFYFLH